MNIKWSRTDYRQQEHSLELIFYYQTNLISTISKLIAFQTSAHNPPTENSP